MLFGAHIIHFRERTVPHRVINVINSECLFLRGSCWLRVPAGQVSVYSTEKSTLQTQWHHYAPWVAGGGDRGKSARRKYSHYFSPQLPGIGSGARNSTSPSGSFSVVSRSRSVSFWLKLVSSPDFSLSQVGEFGQFAQPLQILNGFCKTGVPVLQDFMRRIK